MLICFVKICDIQLYTCFSNIEIIFFFFPRVRLHFSKEMSVVFRFCSILHRYGLFFVCVTRFSVSSLKMIFPEQLYLRFFPVFFFFCLYNSYKCTFIHFSSSCMCRINSRLIFSSSVFARSRTMPPLFPYELIIMTCILWKGSIFFHNPDFEFKRSFFFFVPISRDKLRRPFVSVFLPEHTTIEKYFLVHFFFFCLFMCFFHLSLSKSSFSKKKKKMQL